MLLSEIDIPYVKLTILTRLTSLYVPHSCKRAPMDGAPYKSTKGYVSSFNHGRASLQQLNALKQTIGQTIMHNRATSGFEVKS